MCQCILGNPIYLKELVSRYKTLQEDNVASIMETSWMRLASSPLGHLDQWVDLGWSNICFLVWSFKMRPVDTKSKERFATICGYVIRKQGRSVTGKFLTLTISGVSTWLHLQPPTSLGSCFIPTLTSLASPPIPSS